MALDVGTETEPFNPLGIAAAAVAVSAWGLSGVIAKDIDMSGTSEDDVKAVESK